MPTFSIVAQTGSTNSDLLANAIGGAAVSEGHWHIALSQDAGRGRQGRVWISEIGNFHGSTVVVDRTDDPPPATLALVVAIALYDALAPMIPAHASIPVGIKWPNDVMVGSAKIAGILLERSHGITVVGVGVNLAFAPKQVDRDTVALSDFGARHTPDSFAPILAEQFAGELAAWRNTGLADVLARWDQRAIPRGTALTVTNGLNAGLTGRFDGLDRAGNLRLRYADGAVVTISSGEVLMDRDFSQRGGASDAVGD